MFVGEGARDEASEAATIVSAMEFTFISKLLEGLAGRRGCEGGAEKSLDVEPDRDFCCKAVLGSARSAREIANGAFRFEIRGRFVPFSSDASNGPCAPNRRVRGEGVECVDSLIQPTGCAVVVAALAFLVIEGPEAVKLFPSSTPSGNVLSELSVDNVGLIGGLTGVGLAIADAGLVT